MYLDTILIFHASFDYDNQCLRYNYDLNYKGTFAQRQQPRKKLKLCLMPLFSFRLLTLT